MLTPLVSLIKCTGTAVPKLLIVASLDRLDTPLTIGQMSGELFADSTNSAVFNRISNCVIKCRFRFLSVSYSAKRNWTQYSRNC